MLVVAVASLMLLLVAEAALAETGRQRFHITYAGPVDPADPPERRITAAGPIKGKGFERLLTEAPGTEPGSALVTTEWVFRDGSVFSSVTSQTRSFRFNQHSCKSFRRISGSWVITGGTDAYAGATGNGTFEGHNIVSFEKTREGCTQRPKRLVSNIRLVGTATVPNG